MTAEPIPLEEAAEETALTPEEIIKAEDAGILPRGKRQFTSEDVRLLTGISCLLHLGFSMEDIMELRLSPFMLAEIDQYLGVTPQTAAPHTCLITLDSARDVIRGHLNDMDHHIQQLKEQRVQLEHRLNAFDRIIDKIEGKIEG
jgi:DNA-binding transcriptional MerR regulator